jgi:hypothetical protein
MKKLLVLAATSITLALASPALASGNAAQCGKATGQWMTKDAAKTKAAEQGYDVRRVKREDGCFEVYAIDKNGSKVELYMNPVSGEIVKIKTKS